MAKFIAIFLVISGLMITLLLVLAIREGKVEDWFYMVAKTAGVTTSLAVMWLGASRRRIFVFLFGVAALVGVELITAAAWESGGGDALAMAVRVSALIGLVWASEKTVRFIHARVAGPPN